MMSEPSKKEMEKMIADLQRAARISGERIEQSAVFLSIFTENYEKDAKAILEFGLAIVLDKPIYMVVPEGTKVPENVKRVARGIEYYNRDDTESLHAATKRLLKGVIN